MRRGFVGFERVEGLYLFVIKSRDTYRGVFGSIRCLLYEVEDATRRYVLMLTY